MIKKITLSIFSVTFLLSTIDGNEILQINNDNHLKLTKLDNDIKTPVAITDYHSSEIFRNVTEILWRNVRKSPITDLAIANKGNLAILSMAIIGGLALMSPDFLNRRLDTNHRQESRLDRILSKILDFSTDSLPLIENEITQIKRLTARNARNAQEKFTINDYISSRFTSISEWLMLYAEKTLDSVPALPRLDAQACMKRCICEAHHQPKKYGLVGLVLQLFFPPYIESDTPSKIISKYQLAARYGRSENANCAVQYDDCIVNFLDLIQSFTRFFK